MRRAGTVAHRHSDACRVADAERSSGWRVLLEIVIAREERMNGLIYLIGLIVVILFILSFLGLR